VPPLMVVNAGAINTINKATMPTTISNSKSVKPPSYETTVRRGALARSRCRLTGGTVVILSFLGHSAFDIVSKNLSRNKVKFRRPSNTREIGCNGEKLNQRV